MKQDIRWEQRFSNFEKALDRLTQAINYIMQNLEQKVDSDQGGELATVLDEIIKEGLIQRFEYTHELAWNVMKDYAAYQGNSNIGGSRDATREAFQINLISDGEVWMDMIGSRNQTSHAYNEEVASEIYSKILYKYYPAFTDFRNVMEGKKGN